MTDTTRAPIYGPWGFTEGDDQNPMNGCIHDVNGELLNLRVVCDDDDRQLMRLMAAAPELLEALEWSRQQIKDLCRTVNILSVKAGGTPRKVHYEDYAEKACAALAKAKGEQS